FGALGLKLGDAHVIRNAGGIVTDDVLRSLIVSHHMLGTQEAVVIGHTNCGLAGVTEEEIHARVGSTADDMEFHAFPDTAERVRQSVRAIDESPLLADTFGATGFVYDV